MESTSLRRTAVVIALLALPACGPTDTAGAGPSDSSSTPAATSSAGTGDKTDTASPTASPSHHDHRGKPDDGKDDEPTPAHAASGICDSGDLHVSTEPAGAAAGHDITRLVFQNTSDHACWVRGYPGVSYVAGDDGHQVGGSALRDSSHGPSAARIWLIPNAHAYALLNQPNPHNFTSGDCDPTSVRGLRVYPPEETSSLYAPDSGTACANTGTGRPLITALSKSPQQ